MSIMTVDQMTRFMDQAPSDEQVHCPVRRVSHGPGYHYFGYYDKCPWNQDGSLLAGMQTLFVDHHPSPDEAITVGVIDMKSQGDFIPLARSVAWNWQQGCMLRWRPAEHRELMFNDRVDGKFVTVLLDPRTGRRQTWLDRPTYDISDDGNLAASLNFGRVSHCRPGYGYNTGPLTEVLEKQPQDDGLYLTDTRTQQSRLVLSIRDAARVGQITPGPADRAWFNHLKFNPSSSRLLFLHRWASQVCSGHTGFTTRVMVLDVATGQARCVCEGYGASHFDWQDDRHLLIYLYHPQGDGYYLIDVTTGQMKMVGQQKLPVDGHCVYRPQRDWLATDTYPLGPQALQTLMLFHLESCKRVDIGYFAAIPTHDPALRCDLHSRWDRQGRQLCFDSTHEGHRQMYVMDVSKVVGS